MKDQEYNGYKNYETWNVALWISNDDALNNYAVMYKNRGYKSFIQALKINLDNNEVSQKTPDGVLWDDSNIDIETIDELMLELTEVE